MSQQRTGNSIIFDVEARLTTSYMPRFRWTSAHITAFMNYIQANPQGYFNLDSLLQALDLDGYTDNILNADGKSVREMIEKKVKHKLCSLRGELDS
ncbi:hypothetical protein F4680DRAFT_424216 [Xylaria scruposa]|nr:hypothetical protein F4680DRAFT_424216 [Xylaria scruposa]